MSDLKAVIVRSKGLGVKTPIIAENMKNKCEVIRLDKQDAKIAPYVFRWGYTGYYPGDSKVFNTSAAIGGTSDKRNFRRKMAKEGLAPKFYNNLSEVQDAKKGSKFVVRPEFHQRSEHIYLCNNFGELQAAADACGGGYYISDYIPKVEEFRVFVAQNRVVWVISKSPTEKDAVSWGCVNQGDFEYVGWQDWNLAVVGTAVAAFDLSGLHFGAVDVLLDGAGKAYALEINTAPYLTPYYAERIANVFDFMIGKSGRFDLPEKIKSYKDIIHPAIKGE